MRINNIFHVSTKSYLTKLTYSLVFLFLATISKKVDAYITTLDAHSEECFFENAVAGTKLGFVFEVMEGGFLDIDVTIYDPQNAIIHQEPRASSGKYTIEANQNGAYKYCFSNKMSSVTPKLVMFSIETAKQVESRVSHAQESDKLNVMVRDLTNSVVSAKHELEYLTVRDKIHRDINESTNSRVVAWSFFEFIVLLGVSICQVYYLKRFFEVRRVT